MKKLLLIVLMLAQSLWVFGQDGSLDPSFDVGQLELIQGGISGPVFSKVVQTDGKILVGGSFLNFNNIPRRNIARLNVDGSLDTSFNPGSGASISVNSIALQADGKIIIGGRFTSYNGVVRNRIARLNIDGSLDPTFNPGTGADNTVTSIAIQHDGKIIIGGFFNSFDGSTIHRIARLNTDGSLDTTFDPGTGADNSISIIVIQADGKIIIGGTFTSYNGTSRNRIARLKMDGSLDMVFDPGTGSNQNVRTAALQPDGKIIIGGWFSSFNGVSRNRIARLNTNGSLDTSFNPGTGANNWVEALVLQTDGKILIGGRFTAYNNIPKKHLALLNPDGSLDSSFDPILDIDVSSLSLQSDGRLIVGISSSYQFYVTRINLDGSLDNAFTFVSGNVNISTIKKQSDGKILIGGNFTHVNEVESIGFARLNPDGSLDNSINIGLNIIPTSCCFQILVQSDQKIILIYGNTGIRLNPDGSLDNSFNGSAINGTNVNTIIQQSDEKIIFSIFSTIRRINSDGSLDPNFNPGSGANNEIRSIVLQEDGKILIAGNFTAYNGIPRNRIARLNPDGSLDTSFDPGTGASSTVNTVSLQSDGKIIIGGQFTTYNGTPRIRIARLNADGSLDTSFTPGTGANSTISTLIYQPDGKIIITGQFSTYNGIPRNRIAKLNADGTLDTSFNLGSGANNTVSTAVQQPDGKIIIGGIFTSYDGSNKSGVARILNDFTSESDMDPPVPDEEFLSAFKLSCEINVEDLPIPTATDNVDGKILGVTDESIFPITEPGTYTITWTYSDEAGNSSTQEQEIVLEATSAPLVCVDNQVVESNQDSCEYTHTDTTWDVLPVFSCYGGVTILSDFSEDLEGWTRRTPSDPNSTVVYRAEGGNPGGFARFNEPGQGTPDYFAAPSKFKGDKSIFYGGSISMDLKSNRSTTLLTNYLLMSGNGITLQSKSGRINNIWTNYEILLLPEDWTISGSSSTQPTESQLRSVLSNINDLSVKADWISGAETVDLDNFTMTALASVYYELSGATVGAGTSLNGAVFQKGETLVTWKQNNGTDSYTTCSFTVKVEDKVAPVPDLEELPTIIGECFVEIEAPTATDNCSGIITGSTSSPLIYAEQGFYTIEWIFDDGNGNQSKQSQKVTVSDSESPEVFTKGITVYLDGDGIATIVAADIDNGSTDNCGIASYSLDKEIFGCADVGNNTVTLMVTDINGNSADATAVVTVLDNSAPVWSTPINSLLIIVDIHFPKHQEYLFHQVLREVQVVIPTLG
jgi:uncharacterized delta-60 repeat protein